MKDSRERTRKTPIASIVLCAGKGKRMKAPRTPKVCFPVAGKPAVAHLIERLEALGVGPNVMVVGHLAGAVMDEIGPRFPASVFVHQKELHGTGHATRRGADLLERLGFDGAVLVVAGDKVVELRALEKLIRVFEEESADLALVVAPKEHWPSAGRILTDGEGRVRRIVEKADLRLGNAEDGGDGEDGNAVSFELDGERLSAAEVEERVEWVNQAVYLFRAEVLYESLKHLRKDNVQGEEYLTDTVDWLARRGGKILPAPVDDPEDVLGFNNPAELLEIQEHFRRKGEAESGDKAEPPRGVFKPPEEWAKRLANPDADAVGMLRDIYGDKPGLCEEKRRRLLRAVEFFIERFGTEGEAAVIRAPGRVNLMGRHIDHRGGDINLMAIDKESIMVVRKRGDTVVRALNVDGGRFRDLEFSMGELLERVQLDDWREFVDSEMVTRMLRDLEGDWGNYLKAPMLRMQREFSDRQIHGVDCVVSGDIPMAAGLSSSSTLVVAMAEALALTNGLGVSPTDLVNLCGEGEWFVGTRGGSGDHAAIKMSRSGRIARVGFFPFEIKEYLPFPEGYALVIADSRVQARKAESARDAFNERIASYDFAVELVRKRFPNYEPFIKHLRDITPQGLEARAADVYRVLLDVPERMTPDELAGELGRETFDRIVANHRPRDCYALRGRLLFGIAECERSRLALDLLRDGKMERFGRLMGVSHDGDRVRDGQGSEFCPVVDDAMLRRRIEDLRSEDPERVLRGQLYAQPGVYACSVAEIDRMVDVALDTPGVLGAQLAGAGLGGCMMILAEDRAADAVIARMNAEYYEPNGLEPGAFAFSPVAGCCSLSLK